MVLNCGVELTVFKAVRFDDFLCPVCDVAGIDGDDALCTCPRSEERQNAGAAANVENDGIPEHLRRGEDVCRIRRRSDLILDHDSMDF